jgi:hypothetical protein
MIAVMFYVEDDSAISAETAQTVCGEALTPARISKIRDGLSDELGRVRRGLAEVWSEKALAACEGRYVASVDHIAAGKLASILYDQLQERRTEILGTLDRISAGDFGNCVLCGNTIPYGELETSPETLSCTRCSQ